MLYTPYGARGSAGIARNISKSKKMERAHFRQCEGHKKQLLTSMVFFD